MALKSDWPCWEIMKCEGTNECPARTQPHRPCWEIAGELDDYRKAFNICKDCVVYMLKATDTVLTDNEVRSIVKRKTECILSA